jgi:hypothetical protein
MPGLVAFPAMMERDRKRGGLRDGDRDEFASVLTESTYLEQIAPRLEELWTREEILALRDT